MPRPVTYEQPINECTKSEELKSYRVPSRRSREAVRVAPRVVTCRDIREDTWVGVKERIQESERRFARSDEVVVDE